MKPSGELMDSAENLWKSVENYCKPLENTATRERAEKVTHLKTFQRGILADGHKNQQIKIRVWHL